MLEYSNESIVKLCVCVHRQARECFSSGCWWVQRLNIPWAFLAASGDSRVLVGASLIAFLICGWEGRSKVELRKGQMAQKRHKQTDRHCAKPPIFFCYLRKSCCHCSFALNFSIKKTNTQLAPLELHGQLGLNSCYIGEPLCPMSF